VLTVAGRNHLSHADPGARTAIKRLESRDRGAAGGLVRHR
jgi:hypothetical protein